MAWSEKFFTQRRLTSKLKHFVLQRYVKEFALHLGSVRPLVYYVDGSQARASMNMAMCAKTARLSSSRNSLSILRRGSVRLTFGA